MASIKELGQCLGTEGSGRLVVALLWANAAWAAPTASWMPSSFAAQFTQIYTSAVSGKEQRGQGSLDYAYPGQIRFQATDPDPFIFTSNGHKTWYYYPPFIEGESGELSIQNQGNLWLNQFFDLLRDGPKTNNRFTAQAQANQWNLKFKPDTAEKVQALAAVLKFKTKSKKFLELQEIELTKQDKKKVRFLLEKITPNPALAKNHFEFTAPPNTKVKYRP